MSQSEIVQTALRDFHDLGSAIRAIVETIQRSQRWRECAYLPEHFPLRTEQELLLALRLLAEQLEDNSEAVMQAVIEAMQRDSGSNIQ